MKFTNLDPQVQRHLQKTYATLTAALVVSALGSWMDITFRIAGLLTYLLGFGCLVGLGLTQSTPSTLNKRYTLLAGFAFAQGASLGPLIGAAIAMSPGIVLMAFACTAAIFLCFSAASLLTKRRSFLYLGGWLSSAISAFMVMRLCSWFVPGMRAVTFQAELTLGLLVFAGYIIFDTQVIIEKAYAGHTDHIKSALDLLVDVLAVFVRVLVILMRNAEKKEQRERERRNKRQ